MTDPTAELTHERHMAALQWGMRVFLATQIIPFIVLFTVRYEIDGWYVAPTVNQWMGAGEQVLMLISLWYVTDALRQVRADHLAASQQRLKSTIAVGALYLGLVIYEWSQRFVPVGTHFGETFYPAIGVSAFYTLVGLFVLTAVALRSGRVGLGERNYWDIQAVTWYWVFQGLAALAVYIFLYWF
jgi:cytochrome c oxidase subunit 3